MAKKYSGIKDKGKTPTGYCDTWNSAEKRMERVQEATTEYRDAADALHDAINDMIYLLLDRLDKLGDNRKVVSARVQSIKEQQRQKLHEDVEEQIASDNYMDARLLLVMLKMELERLDEELETTRSLLSAASKVDFQEDYLSSRFRNLLSVMDI
jgi:hypothetical protein